MDLQFPFVRIFENRNERRERRGEREKYISRREMRPRIDEGGGGGGFEKQRNRVVFVQIRLIGKYLHEKGGANLPDGTK